MTFCRWTSDKNHFKRPIGSERYSVLFGTLAISTNRDLRIISPYGKTTCMENIRPEVGQFLRSCEHLFGFTHESGKLTPEECQLLEYYVEELHKQIAPHCTAPLAPCDDSPTSSSKHWACYFFPVLRSSAILLLWIRFKVTSTSLPPSKPCSVFRAFSVTACTRLASLLSRQVCCSISTGILSAKWLRSLRRSVFRASQPSRLSSLFRDRDGYASHWSTRIGRSSSCSSLQKARPSLGRSKRI